MAIDSVWFFFSFILLYDHVFFGVRWRPPPLCRSARPTWAPALGWGCAPARGCWGWCRGPVWPRPVRFHTGHVDQTTRGIGRARWKKFPLKISDLFEPLQTPSDCPGMSVNPGSDRIVAGITDGLLSGVEEQGCQHSQVSRGEPGIGGDGVREGGEGDTGVVMGPPWRTLPPSGPRVRGRHRVTEGGGVHGRSPCSPARNRSWNVGAALARVVRSSARRRARSSGASGPKCGGASEEFSVMGSDRPLHWFVGRLEWRIRTPSPGNRGWISPRPGSLGGMPALATQIEIRAPGLC